MLVDIHPGMVNSSITDAPKYVRLITKSFFIIVQCQSSNITKKLADATEIYEGVGSLV